MMDTTEILELEAGGWRLTAPLPSRRAGLRATVLDNKIFLFGENILCYINIEDLILSQGRRQSRKKNKSVLNKTLQVLTPPPPLIVFFYNLFFLSFWHHQEHLWSEIFFPLEKVKNTQNIFTKSVLRRGWNPPPPPPPHQGEKNFFAFLDELDHFMQEKKSVFLTLDPPSPRKKSVFFKTLLFFFLL